MKIPAGRQKGSLELTEGRRAVNRQARLVTASHGGPPATVKARPGETLASLFQRHTDGDPFSAPYFGAVVGENSYRKLFVFQDGSLAVFAAGLVTVLDAEAARILKDEMLREESPVALSYSRAKDLSVLKGISGEKLEPAELRRAFEVTKAAADQNACTPNEAAAIKRLSRVLEQGASLNRKLSQQVCSALRLFWGDE